MPTNRLSSFFRCLAVCASLIATGVASEERYTLPNGERVKPLDSFRECDFCPEMVVMPLGQFVMGADLDESRRLAELQEKLSAQLRPYGFDEGPKHSVQMDIPYAIGRYEVTRGEWMACVRAAICQHSPNVIVGTRNGIVLVDEPNAPVFDVSYNYAQQFLDWLNSRVGTDTYRLPTEAEWEYAARGGTTTTFSQGNKLDKSQANFTEFQLVNGQDIPIRGQRMAPVAVNELDPEHPWGLAHIAGNLRELTSSCYEDFHLGLSSRSAYLNIHRDVEFCSRVLKDGSYSGVPEHSRPAARAGTSETRRRDWIGFRVLRELR